MGDIFHPNNIIFCRLIMYITVQPSNKIDGSRDVTTTYVLLAI